MRGTTPGDRDPRAEPESTDSLPRHYPKIPSWPLSDSDWLRWLDGWPLLRQLIFDPWFRWGSAITLLLLIGGLALFPRWWRVTPPRFEPVLRVRTLDLIHADRAAKAARRDDLSGDYESALSRWREAIVHQPGSVEFHAGLLEHLLRRSPRDRQRRTLATQRTLWLLQLESTNAHSLRLASRVFEYFRADDWWVAVASPVSERLENEERSQLAQSKFRLGDFKGFQETLRPPLDPISQLYSLTATALRETNSSANGPFTSDAWRSASNALREARSQSSTRTTALRLSLYLAARSQSLPDYAEALNELARGDADEPRQHVAYWKLLTASGRRNEAVALAKNVHLTPLSGPEATLWADALAELGLNQQALDLLEDQAPLLGSLNDPWLVQARLLTQNSDWFGLRQLALRIRENPGTRVRLRGYGDYLEGLALLAEKLTNQADVAFSRISSDSIADPLLAWQVGERLVRLGHSEPGKNLLLTHETTWRGQANYWSQLARIADQQRDADLLLKASREAYQLAPNRPQHQNLLAAALILHRREPVILHALTSRLIQDFPNELPSRLNHLQALILNSRIPEAGDLLRALNVEKLPPEAQPLRWLAEAEWAVSAGKSEMARNALSQVQTNRLYALQLRRIAELKEQLLTKP